MKIPETLAALLRREEVTLTGSTHLACLYLRFGLPILILQSVSLVLLE